MILQAIENHTSQISEVNLLLINRSYDVALKPSHVTKESCSKGVVYCVCLFPASYFRIIPTTYEPRLTIQRCSNIAPTSITSTHISKDIYRSFIRNPRLNICSGRTNVFAACPYPPSCDRMINTMFIMNKHVNKHVKEPPPRTYGFTYLERLRVWKQ